MWPPTAPLMSKLWPSAFVVVMPSGASNIMLGLHKHANPNIAKDPPFTDKYRPCYS